jgi:hypothetical protein
MICINIQDVILIIVDETKDFESEIPGLQNQFELRKKKRPKRDEWKANYLEAWTRGLVIWAEDKNRNFLIDFKLTLLQIFPPVNL